MTYDSSVAEPILGTNGGTHLGVKSEARGIYAFRITMPPAFQRRLPKK